MASPGEAKDMVVGSLLLTGLLVGVHQVSHGHRPEPRQVFGLLGAGVFLTFLAEPAPGLAASLAALVAVGTLFTVGADSLAAIRRAAA